MLLPFKLFIQLTVKGTSRRFHGMVVALVRGMLSKSHEQANAHHAGFQRAWRMLWPLAGLGSEVQIAIDAVLVDGEIPTADSTAEQGKRDPGGA